MPQPKTPAPTTTKCGFHGPDFAFADEGALRTAVVSAAVKERAVWFDTSAGRLERETSNARFKDLVRYWLAGHNSLIHPGKLEAVQLATAGVTYGNLTNAALQTAIQSFAVAEVEVNTRASEVYTKSAAVDRHTAAAKAATAAANQKTAELISARKRLADARGGSDTALIARRKSEHDTAEAARDVAVKARDDGKRDLAAAATALKNARAAHTLAKDKRSTLKGAAEAWDKTDLKRARTDLLAKTVHPDKQKIETTVDDALQLSHNSRADSEAWSSAFIGATVRSAAIALKLESMATSGSHEGKDVLLFASRRHSDYVKQALALNDNSYQAFTPTTPVLQPGDIIVTDRGDFISSPAGMTAAAMDARPLLHGDIVVDFGSAGGQRFATTVGGNVRHSVRQRRYPLDASGHLIVKGERLYATEDDSGAFVWPLAPAATTTMLDVASTGRILALLSPVKACRKVPAAPPAPSGSSGQKATPPKRSPVRDELESIETPFLTEEVLVDEFAHDSREGVEQLVLESPFADLLLEWSAEESDPGSEQLAPDDEEWELAHAAPESRDGSDDESQDEADDESQDESADESLDGSDAESSLAVEEDGYSLTSQEESGVDEDFVLVEDEEGLPDPETEHDAAVDSLADQSGDELLASEIAAELPERELEWEGAGIAVEHETPPMPKGVPRFEHWIAPLKRDAATDSWISAGAEELLEPLDPGFLDASGEIKPSPLGQLLSDLLLETPAFRAHLTSAAVKEGKATAGDRLRVALVDLTGSKLLHPEFAGWGSTVPVDGASCPKVAALYAAFQLRNDLKHVAAAEKITTTAALIVFMNARWKQEGIVGPPRLSATGSRPGFLYDQTQPPDLEFSAAIDKAVDDIISQHGANDAARVLIDIIGFPYIASLLWQSGLRHPTRGGLWLTTSYGGGASWSGASRPAPTPLFGHNVTALSLVTFFALLGQGRLAPSGLPRTIRTALSTASWFRPPLPSAAIASKVGLLKKCLSSGPKMKDGKPVLKNGQPVIECKVSVATHVHEAALIENGRFRYAVAILTTGIPAGVSLLQALIAELDALIQKNNP